MPDLLKTIEKRRIYIDISSKRQEPSLITESSKLFQFFCKELIASLMKMSIENTEDIKCEPNIQEQNKSENKVSIHW